MDFRLLGPLEVATDGRALTPTRPRERAVLALLLLRGGRTVGADECIDAVWGEEPPPTARTALQGVVSSLRRRLGAERIETRAPGYRLVLQSGDRYDVAEVEALVAAAAGEPPDRRSALLREALSLFRGEPLADVALVGFEPEAARLAELRLAAEEAAVAADLELDRHAEVLPRLERLVAEQPLREGLRGQLMLALYRSGRQADALRVAQDARRVLALELGVEPGPTLQQLERQILDQDPALLSTGSARSDLADRDAALAIRQGTATFLAVHDPPDEPGARQRLIARASRHGGVEVPSSRGLRIGFVRARDAAVAAAAMQREVQRGAPRLRIGLASVGPEHVAAVAHPGQVVLAHDTRELLREAPLHEVDVRELGGHRLADLAPPQPLYQLMAVGLDVDFPPTPGLESRATNLPVQPTTLIGREAEIEAVVGLLGDGTTRLVSLTGPGGIGKTRLAVHAAAALLDDAPDGTWFVALEALTDPALVVPAIASAIGSGIDAGGADAGGSLAALGRELRDRRMLLVLDNFEHLVPAAGLVEELLAATTSLRIIVTSRVPLKRDGERVVALSPLSAPPTAATEHVAELSEYASVALFVERARDARPGFALGDENAGSVAALCRALDGLPLAVELAASQVGLLPPATLLQRLDRGIRRLSRAGHGPERHRALQATIEWSHELLDEEARELFADVAVFAGGWTLEAAEAVCGAGRDVVGGLAGLVDQSLVRVGGTETEPRFGMLETIREYAAAQLDASGRRPDLESRHAAHFQALADAAEPHLRGNPGAFVARLEREHDNLRAAVDRLAAQEDGASEARLVGTLWRFWYLAGHLGEGRRRLEHALSVHRERTPARLKALLGAAVMAVNSGEAAVARDHAVEALGLSRDLGDAWSAAYAQFMLGAALGALDDDAGARAAEEASLAAFRALGDEHSALLVSRNLAATLEALGERSAAEELFRDNLRRAREERNGRLEASTLGALASIAFDAGRIGDAMLMLRESLRLHRELADRLDTAVDLSRAAQVLAISGRTDAAARLVGALLVVRAELGARGRMVTAGIEAASVSLGRQVGEHELREWIAEGETISLEEALSVALEALS